MSRHFNGLDKAAIFYAIKQTVQRTLITCLASAVLCGAIMQMTLGMVHPLGLFCAFILPMVLSAPTTLNLNLKHQQLRAANKRLHALASTDCLTGTMNRRSFSQEVEELLRKPGHNNYALLLLDLDNFKTINDTYGHQAGDIALITMAQSVREHFGDGVPFARIGGEEFAMFIPDMDARRSSEIAQSICAHVRTTDYSAAGIDRKISVSIGVATAAEGSTLSQLLRVADQKMYLAKNKGRNRVESDDLKSEKTTPPGMAA